MNRCRELLHGPESSLQNNIKVRSFLKALEHHKSEELGSHPRRTLKYHPYNLCLTALYSSIAPWAGPQWLMFRIYKDVLCQKGFVLKKNLQDQSIKVVFFQEDFSYFLICLEYAITCSIFHSYLPTNPLFLYLRPIGLLSECFSDYPWK